MSAQRAIDVLYYTSRVKTEEGLVSNQNELSPTFTNPPSGGLGFVSVLPLSDHKFDQYTDNNYHALYEGCRVPANNGKQYLAVALFKEDVNIVTPRGSLRATCVYPDTGSSSETSVPFTEFIVTGATGTFSGAKKILIEYSNDGTAPWARDGDNKPVSHARRMTLLGDGEAVPNAKVQSRNSLRTMLL